MIYREVQTTNNNGDSSLDATSFENDMRITLKVEHCLSNLTENVEKKNGFGCIPPSETTWQKGGKNRLSLFKNIHACFADGLTADQAVWFFFFVNS